MGWAVRHVFSAARKGVLKNSEAISGTLECRGFVVDFELVAQ